MAVTITSILNSWNQAGVFSYVLPFLLIFAMVFALLQKTAIFAKKKTGGEPQHNTTIEAIIAAAIGLLALQLDVVSIFFANIFPKFGVGLAIFLVLIIFLGFFYSPDDPKEKNKLSWIGWVVGIGVVVWALLNWGTWFDGSGGYSFMFWIDDYLWALIVLGIVVGAIIAIKKAAK